MLRSPTLLVALALVALCAPAAYAQSHFSTCLDGGSNVFNATIIVPVASNPNIDGAALAPGSEIAVFASDPLFPDLCVGLVQWQGNAAYLTVWGDDDLTPTRDGLLPNEQLHYRVWDSASGTEYGNDDITAAYVQGAGRYSHDGLMVFGSLAVTSSAPGLPAAPTLDTPADNATALSVSPTLAWNAAAGATSYRLQVASDASFNTLVYNQGGLSGMSQQVAGLDYQTTYHWRARATNATGDSPWSAAWSFTTENMPTGPPSAPIPSSPAKNAVDVEVNPTLIWNPGAGATTYRLQVAIDATFNTKIFDQNGLTGTSQQITGLDTQRIYYWRVRAINGSGFSAWSARYHFTTGNTPVGPPPVPVLASPAHGANDVSISATLAWNTASGADNYHLQVATDANFSNVVFNQGNVSGTSQQVAGLDYETTYHWRVQAANSAGTGGWSGAWSFTTENTPVAVPPAPALASPTNGATGVEISPTLTWNTAAGATAYRVQVATDANFSNVIFNQGSLPGTSHQIPGLDYATAYFWRAQASNSAGSSPWSGGWRFTTENAPIVAPPAPTLVSPPQASSGVTIDPTLQWNAAHGAVTYHVQVTLGSDPGFYTPIVDEPSVTDLFYDLANLAYETEYRWRVKASNSAGASPWTGAWTFTTENAPIVAPPAPTLATPSDGAAGIEIDPMLTWNATPNTNYYRLQVATDANFGNIIKDEPALNSVTHQLNGLNHTTTYYWRVRAGNAGGNSPWSTPCRFTTEEAPATLPSAPRLRDPAHRATNVPVNAAFAWDPSANATTYHLQVSISRHFTTLAIDESTLSGTSFTASGLDYTTRYFWRVRASNTAGHSTWSSRRKFTTENAPIVLPPAPTLVSPGDGATDVIVNPTLTWNAVTEANTYRLQVATDINFSDVVFNLTGMTSTVRQVAGLDPETTYFWRVQANNAGGSGPWSSAWRFTTENAPPAPPDIPQLRDPANRAINVSVTPTLTWYAAANAATYRVQVSTSHNFSSLIVDEKKITGTSFSISGLQYGRRYFWRVRASNTTGFSAWSGRRRFTTEKGSNESVAAPPLVEPANGTANAATSVLLVWASAGGASAYQVQMSERDDFSRVVMDEGNLAGTTYEVEDLQEETTYYWRVRASNPVITSTWSRIQNFTTGTSAGLLAPRPSRPTHAAQDVTVPTTFVWQVTPFATAYRLQVMQLDASGGVDEVVMDSTGLLGSSLQISTLRPGTEYIWHVKALSSLGEGPWSNTYVFRTRSDGTPTATEAEEDEVPETVTLHQNYPNPFNPETTISFDLPSTQHVTIKIYDMLGQELATLVAETLPAGRHEARWDARGLPSGVYLYQLRADRHTETRALSLIK